MKTSNIAFLPYLLTTTYAATVTLKMTPCISNDTELLEVGPITIDELFVQDLQTVCGLELLSASDIDINTITCQAYQDAEGTVPGSAPFTKAEPALISTNPVQEGSILCTASEDASSSALSSTTTIPSSFVSSTTTIPSSFSSSSTTQTQPVSVTTISDMTMSITSIVTAASTGTGIPSPGRNTTVLTVTGGPTSTFGGEGPGATGTGVEDAPGSAGRKGVAAGAVAVGFLVWLL